MPFADLTNPMKKFEEKKSTKVDKNQQKKWDNYKKKIFETTGEDFDQLANEKLSLQEIDNNMLQMMGELEANIPNTRK